MKLSRVVAAGLAAASIALCPSPRAWAQSAPKLSKAQRAILEALVAVVDRAATTAATVPASWQSHVLRASDGSHNVAVRTLVPSAGPAADGLAMYVRLATRRPGPTATSANHSAAAPERSAVREWLAGLRGDPLPMRAGRAIAVPQGEMPVGGAAASSRRASEATDATSALRLLVLQQERATRTKADHDAKRLAELEQAGGLTSVMLPFEDFDFAARATVAPDGALDIRRGITAGPGDYDLFIAWSGTTGRNTAIAVVHHRLTLPAAPPTFAVSDLIVAERIAPVAAPYPAPEQSAHPYVIGVLDVTPATANVLSADGTLGLVYQVISPSGSAAGKPSVEVRVEVARVLDDRFVAFASLQPQRHDQTTLPSDFHTAKGHPLFGAVQASLTTFPRGRYRVTVTAVDRLSERRASAEATFDVRGTAESLLREAPVPGQPFRRESVLTPPVLAALARALRPPAPTEALARGLDAAAAGRFAELTRVDTTVPSEQPVVQALLGLGLYGLGDSPRAVTAQLSQAASRGAPAAPVLLLLGAAAALGGDDRGAVASWNQAREGGIDDAAVAAPLIDAYMRQGDVARAAAMATAALDSQPGNVAAAQGLAATYIATARYADALALLDARAATTAPDAETDFLVLLALYGGLVGNSAPGNTASGRERLQAAGRRYVDVGGRYAALVKEWLAVVSGR